MKKLLIILGSIFAVIVLILLLVPFFVSSDTLKQKVVEGIESNLNAKTKLSSIRLSVIPSVKLTIKDFSLQYLPEDQKKYGLEKPLIDSKELVAGVEWLPLLTGKISVIIKSSEPSIYVKQLSNGKFSPELLIKRHDSKSAPSTESVSPETSQKINDSLGTLRLKVDIVKSSIDLQMKDQKILLSPIDMRLDPLTLKGDTHAELSLGVKYLKDKMKIEGPAHLIADLTMNVREITQGNVILDLSELESEGLPIKIGSGVKLGADTKINHVNLETMDFDVTSKVYAFNFEMDANAKSVDGVISASGSSKPFDLKNLSQYLNEDQVKAVSGKVQLKSFQYGGQKYQAELNFDHVQSKLPKGAVGLNGNLSLNETTLSANNLDILVNQTPIKTNAKIVYQPSIDANITMNAGTLDVSSFVPEMKADEKAQEKPISSSTSKQGSSAKTEAMNPLSAYGKNPLISKAKINSNLTIQKLILKPSYSMDDIKVTFICGAGVCDIKNMNLKPNPGGSLNASGRASIFHPELPFSMKASIAGFDVNRHITAWMPAYSGKLSGTLSGSVNLSGPIYPMEKLKRRINLNLTSKLSNGKSDLVDVNAIMKGIEEKIPLLKGKINDVDISQEYETMNLNIAMKNGVVDIHQMSYVGKGSKTINLESKGQINVDLEGNLEGTITDRANIVKASELKNKNGQAVIPFKVNLPSNSPDVAWMTKELLKQNQGKIKEKVKEKAKEKVQEILKKENVKEGAKKLLKGLGF